MYGYNIVIHIWAFLFRKTKEEPKMEMAIAVLLFVVGLVIIIKGGDFFVDAASWMAEVSGIPKLIVGATVVSLATTLPELLVSAMAAGKGQVDMAIGNAVGSVTANIGLIMAISLIFMPSVIKRKDYMLKGILMLGATFLLMIFGNVSGELKFVWGLVFLVIFAVNIYDNVAGAKAAMKNGKEETEEKESVDKKTITINVVKFVVGTIGIVVGADLLVDQGSFIAAEIGIPERIISVTVIAIGTSLPELITTLTAIAKKQSSLSVGNIIGANIIDLTMILPVCSLVSGGSLPISTMAARIDIPACLIVGLIAMIPTLITKKFTRVQGVVLLVVYAVYVFITSSGVIAF